MNAALLWLATTIALAEEPASDGIRVESSLVTLIDQAEVPAREAGVLVEIAVRAGQTVEAAQLLARIDDTQPVLAAHRARTELEIAGREARNETRLRYAEKAAEVAKAELKRAQESVEKYSKSISDTEMDKLRLAVEQAELQARQSRHELEVAKLTEKLKSDELAAAEHNVQRRQIAAPFAGVVVEIKRNQGEWVEPGASVIRLVRLDRLRVEGFVKAELLAGNVLGRAATLAVDLPGHPDRKVPGTVVFVSPEINPVNGQVRVWVEVENPQALLRPGMRPGLTIAPMSLAGPAATSPSPPGRNAAVQKDRP